MSKLQLAMDTLDASLKTLTMHSGSMNAETYNDCKDIHNDAQTELNDHLALLTAVRKHLAEYTIYPMNAKEAVEMMEEVLGY